MMKSFRFFSLDHLQNSSFFTFKETLEAQIPLKSPQNPLVHKDKTDLCLVKSGAGIQFR